MNYREGYRTASYVMPTSSHALGDAGDADGASCNQPHTRPVRSPAACLGRPGSQPSKGRIVARIMEQVRRFDAKAQPTLKKQSGGPIPSKIYVSRSHEKEMARRQRLVIGKDETNLRTAGVVDHYLVELQSERVGSLAINIHTTDAENPRNSIADQELWNRESQLTLLVAHTHVENEFTLSEMHGGDDSQRMHPTVSAEGECTSTILPSKYQSSTESSIALVEKAHESSFGASTKSQSDYFSAEARHMERTFSGATDGDDSSSLDTYPEEDEVQVTRPWMENTEGQVIRPWMGSAEPESGCIENVQNVHAPQPQAFSPRAASILLQGTSELTVSNSSHSSSDPGLRFDCIGLLHNGFRSCALPVTGECVGRRTLDTGTSED